MNLNPRSIQRHNGVGFWLTRDGLRECEWGGRKFQFRRTDAGWVGHGQQFDTLADAADWVSDSHYIPYSIETQKRAAMAYALAARDRDSGDTESAAAMQRHAAKLAATARRLIDIV